MDEDEGVRLSASERAAIESAVPLRSGYVGGRYMRFVGSGTRGADEPLPAGPSVVDLGRVTPTSVQRAGALLEGRRDARLQVSDSRLRDLDLVADLPPLRYLRIILSLDLADVGGLAAQAGSLRWLELESGLKRLDVSVLGRLHRLQQLYLHQGASSARLNGVQEALVGLSRLRYLVLHSVTLPDPSVLTRLEGLEGLVFKLGGNRDLTSLPLLPRLRFVELWSVRMLEDLTPLAACQHLEVLYLESLRRARLPDFSTAPRLADVTAIGMPNAGGVTGVAAAPALGNLTMVDCKLTAEDIEQLLGHPTLHGVWLPLPRADLDRDTDPILGLPLPDEPPSIASAAGVMGLPVDDL